MIKIDEEIIISKIKFTYENEYGKYKVINYNQENDKYIVTFQKTKNIIHCDKQTILDNKVIDTKQIEKDTKKSKKSNIDVSIKIDSREQITTLLKTLKIDKDYSSDGIKICEVVQSCVKPLGCAVSTGDITIQVRKENQKMFEPTKFCVENKRNGDLVSTLYSDMKRFSEEIKRAKDAELDFIILHNWTFDDVKKHIQKLQGMGKMGYNTQPYLTFLNNYLMLSQKVNIVCCGNDWEETIRRLIKIHIKQNKLQY